MNLSHTNIKFRQRTPWEAADLGRRLISNELGYYCSLYAVLNLPILLIGGLLFWREPFWLTVWLWWLKPLAEYGILAALSVHAFEPLPPWKSTLKNGFSLMLKTQTIGDLTWRRARLKRSFHLPIQQLEQLSKRQFHQRKRELSRYGNGTAATITIFGNALENIWMYSLMLLTYWFLYGNFIEQGLVQPSQIDQLQHVVTQFFSSWYNQEASTFLNYSALAYFITLAFWGPFYVASGFTLYLNARVQTEAWDIRMVWQQLRERIRGKPWHFSWLFVLCFTLSPIDTAHAENLPDTAQIEQNRQDTLEQAPFFHVDNQTQWCWISCDEPMTQNFDLGAPPSSTGGSSVFIQGLAYLLLTGLACFLAYAIWQMWRNHHADHHNEHTTPSHLFGLDLNHENLPKNVSQHALHLLQTDPRSALSLLYRASLSQLVNRKKLPVKEHHTEGQVLDLVQHQLPVLHAFFHDLTQAWLHTAYGHQHWDITHIQQLCQQYAQHFETGPAS